MSLLFLLVFLAAVQNVFAYKIKKNKEHWALFGGYALLTYSISAHEGPDGMPVIDLVTINCKGWGNDACQYEGRKLTQEGGNEVNIADENLVNQMFARAETRQEAGEADGTIAETYAILQNDGTYKYYRYIATWAASDPLNIILDVTQINQ